MPKTITLNTWWAVLPLFLLSLVSCSVKEDRTDCPFYLTVDFGKCDRRPEIIITELDENRAPGNRITDFSEISSTKEQYQVRKGYVNICSYDYAEGIIAEGYSLKITKGEQFPEVYAYSNTIRCTQEEWTESITLHKQYSEITLTINDHTNEDFDCKVELVSDYNGFNLLDLVPSHGDFYFQPQPQGIHRNIFTIRVPRQKGSSLILNISQDDQEIDSLPIGDYILSSGFNWNEEDLDDISLNIDFARMTVSVSILPWEEDMNSNVDL